MFSLLMLVMWLQEPAVPAPALPAPAVPARRAIRVIVPAVPVQRAVPAVRVQAAEVKPPAPQPVKQDPDDQPAAAKKPEKKEAASDEQDPPEEEFEAPPGYADAGVAKDAPAAVIPAIQLQPARAKVDLNAEPDPQVLALEKQVMPQLRQLLQVEMRFALDVCQLDQKELDALQVAADESMRRAAREYALQQHAMMRGGFVANSSQPNPQKSLREGMREHVVKVLPKERADRYVTELDKRRSFQRRTAIRNLVARIDQELVLSVKQQDDLSQLLDKHWQENWVGSLQTLMYSNQYLPHLPGVSLNELLTSEQSQVWNSSQKQGFGFWGGIGFAPAMVVMDDAVLEVGVVEAVEVEAALEAVPVEAAVDAVEPGPPIDPEVDPKECWEID